jgi:uncharacterized membrane protein YbhN (UPF0104 family)
MDLRRIGPTLACREGGAGAVSVTDAQLRQLLRSIALLLVLGAIVVALLATVPSLAAVTRELGHAQTGWVVLAVVAELASCFAFVFFVQGIFWRGPRRLAARLAWTEMAAGVLLPAGGAGGLGLGALILSKLGMPGRAIAICSSVVFLVTSAVTVGALSLFGFGLATGVLAGPQKPLLMLLPALVGVCVIGLFLAVPGPLGRLAEKNSEKHSRLASMVTSLSAGIRESEAVLRHPDWRLLGAVGFWIFDVAALWLAFRALGSAPPFGAVVMGYLVGMAANALPIPGGIGAVDLGLVGMLTVYGARKRGTTRPVAARASSGGADVARSRCVGAKCRRSGSGGSGELTTRAPAERQRAGGGPSGMGGSATSGPCMSVTGGVRVR